MKKTFNTGLILLVLCLSCTNLLAQKQVKLVSPNGKLSVQIAVGNAIEYTVAHEGDVMIAPSAVSVTLGDGKVFGKNAKLKKESTRTVNAKIVTPVYKKSAVTDNYNEQTLEFSDGFNLVFRAYDEGIAYRFVSVLNKPFIVQNEEVNFNFPADHKAFIPYVRDIKPTLEEQFSNSFENIYTYAALSDWDAKRLAFTPILIESVKEKKVCITDADLLNYPGMFLYKGTQTNSLKGVFATYPKEVEHSKRNQHHEAVVSRESFIAQLNGKTNFPWRVIIVSEKDEELANNDMVYKLATPAPQNVDFSWIKPGKVAWDWWNDWNIYGVDFKSGVNNQTYKYYIDFASKNGIEYVILDEGWSVRGKADLWQVIPDIDLKELTAYAATKNVGLILWAGSYAFNKDIEGFCKHYSAMGIKGFKVDFMDRDDQRIVEFLAKSAAIAAKYHLLIDFHGVYKPTGLQRTYPNVINFEGVHGLEQMKWISRVDQVDQVTYDVILPFIRMVAGPVDYTQGAMRNATRGNYRGVYNEAMSQGTRCHQLAEYVIFESPLNMLCDNPSNYMAEPECLAFIATVPTVWDNTVVLNGKVGEYVSIARQSGNDWYVGSLNNWDGRQLALDLSFLGEGNFKAEVFKDGINANRAARDYKKEIITLPTSKKLTIDLAQGGGFVMKITKVN